MVSLQEACQYIFKMGKVTYIQQREFEPVFASNTSKRCEFWLQWHYDFSFRKTIISIIESANENENQNPASSDNETLPDSLIKPKGKRRCIQLLRAEEHFEEEPSERKLDTVETGRDNEEDDTKKIWNSKRKTRYSPSDWFWKEGYNLAKNL